MNLSMIKIDRGNIIIFLTANSFQQSDLKKNTDAVWFKSFYNS